MNQSECFLISVIALFQIKQCHPELARLGRRVGRFEVSIDIGSMNKSETQQHVQRRPLSRRERDRERGSLHGAISNRPPPPNLLPSGGGTLLLEQERITDAKTDVRKEWACYFFTHTSSCVPGNVCHSCRSIPVHRSKHTIAEASFINSGR